MSDTMVAVVFGPDQPERFLTAWFGLPSRDAVQWTATGLPRALVDWHRQVARWDMPVTCQNMVPIQRTMDGDVLLVGIENQGVWLWGVREDGDNPLVWERENVAGADWTETGEHLDEFLWHFTLAEVVFCARFGFAAAYVDSIDHECFFRGWTALDVKPWRWPGPRSAFWLQGGLIAWASVNDRPDASVGDDPYYSVFVAARSIDDLADVDDAGISWDWDSRGERQ